MSEDETVTLSGLGLDDEVADLKRQLAAEREAPDEHPEGLLGKPCPECGYKYGTAWLREELPAEIIQEVESW